MSGSIIPTPAYKAIEWSSFVTQVEYQRRGFISLSLTNFDNNNLPQIAVGSCVEIEGALFAFPSNDSIGGTPSVGINYIMLEVSGQGASQIVNGVWTTTAPTWFDSRQGWYNATGTKRYAGGCYYDGSNYTKKFIYFERIIREYNLDNAIVTESKIGALTVSEGKLAASAVSQTKLKTAMSSVSQAGPDYDDETLPGGEYGFYPQIKMSDTTSTVWHVLISGPQTANHGGWTSYRTSITLAPPSGKTIYAQQRYVTSSGEIYWVFIKRFKTTKEIISVWQAPDHPCFGNGGKPLLVPHPFGNYAPDIHEIIVINPSKEEVLEIQKATVVEDELKPNRDMIEVILEDYEIDEKQEAEWPAIPVTVGLPPDWHEKPMGSPIQPIRKVIPKPDYVKVKKLKRK